MLAKSLADFNQSTAKTKIVYSHHTNHGSAEPFHFLHIGPMSDATMMRRLCVAYFGQFMSSFTAIGQKFGKEFKPEHGQNPACLQPGHQAWHC
jgi:hypothetical protein